MKIRSTNNGFTLMELLPIILVLGLIILIATLTISGIIKNAKGSASNRNIENYNDTKETEIYDKEEDFIEPKQKETKEELPKKETNIFNNYISTYLFTYFKNNPIIKPSNDSNIPKKYKVYENGTPIYFDVTEGKQCTDYIDSQSDTGVKSGCMKFYAFNDNEDSKTVNLLLDHNTIDNVAWDIKFGWANDNESVPSSLLEQLHLDTDNWKGTETPTPLIYNYTNKIGTVYDSNNNKVSEKLGYSYSINYSGYKARLISADEIAQITGNDIENNWTSSTAEFIFYYFDSNAKKESDTCKKENTTGCKYGWLYDRTTTDCTTYGCLNNAVGETKGYWTSSISTDYSNRAWYVLKNACLYSSRISSPTNPGLRPVITVSKSKLS